MPCTRNAWASRGLASTSTLASTHAPPPSAASFSSTGESCLHGSHHSAQKSMTTGVVSDRSSTSVWKVASVTSITVTPPPPARPLAPAARVPARPAAAGRRRSAAAGAGAQRAEVDRAAGEDRRSGPWVAHGYLVLHDARPDRTCTPTESTHAARQKRAGSR